MIKALYQSFDNQSDPDQGPERLNTLRQEIAARDLTGYLVPRADVHQGEYVAARDERLAWLTGFTGSAGFCAVLPTCAGVFVDGRYRVQVKTQVRDVFTPVDWPEVKVPDWLRGNVTEGTIGFDPWLHTLSEIEGYSKALDGSGITLSPCENLIDLIWPDQPDAPMAKAFAYEEKYAGKTHLQKRQDIARVLKDAGQDAAVITLPDSLAWLLNMRGGDVSHVPIAHGFVILHSDASADLFMAADKLSQIGDHLGPDIRVHAPESFDAYLSTLTGRVRIDPDNVPMAVASILTTSGIATQRAQDPTILPKACKNSVELMQARGAHLRDAAAMCEFLCWLDAQAIGTLSEIDVAVALEGFRRADPALTDISFDTISASGPNAALP
ncbi:MAG: aminopeptidase P family N-terminal domain-containing protein, partial [Planktomarina sp.]